MLKRARTLQRFIEGDDDEIAARRRIVLAQCKADIITWVNDWVWTYDPRNAGLDLPTTIPFTLFPRQVECLRWLEARISGQEEGAIEKSRDMGITYLGAALAVHRWLFSPGFKTTFGSRVVDYVDLLGNPDTIFEKIRIIIRHLPWWMRPQGFSWSDHSLYMRLINPENGNVISGEGGKHMGRGGRSTLYFVDEGAFIEQDEAVERAIVAVSETRIWASTVNGMGNVFARKVHSGKIPVFTFHFKDDPRKDAAWEKRKRGETEPHVFASEFDIDYSASVEGICVPAAWVQSARKLGTLIEIEPSVAGVTGFDIGGGKAKSVAITKRGPVVMAPESWSDPDTTDTAHKGLDHTRANGGTHLNYDAPGIGAGVRAALRRASAPGLRIVGVNTGNPPTDAIWPDGKTAKEMFGNLKAELWWMMREAFQRTHQHVLFLEGRDGGHEHPVEELIVLPDDCPGLISELPLVRWFRNKVGKVVIETKDQLKARGIKSPDFADALALAMKPLEGGEVFSMVEEDFVVKPFPIPRHWPKCYGFFPGPDTTAALWGALDRDTDTLYFYAEHCRAHAEPLINVAAIKVRGEWIPGVANPNFQPSGQQDGKQLISDYQALGLLLNLAANASEAGVNAVTDRLSTGRIKVFSTLEKLRGEYQIFRRDDAGKISKDMYPLMNCAFNICAPSSTTKDRVSGLAVAATEPEPMKPLPSAAGGDRTVGY